MKKENTLKVPKERRDEMVSEIKEYFAKEREEEMGDLAAGLMLDFFLENLAPAFYNQGVLDSRQYMQDAAEDLLALRK